MGRGREPTIKRKWRRECNCKPTLSERPSPVLGFSARAYTHKPTLVSNGWSLSALPSKADSPPKSRNVRFVQPIPDIGTNFLDERSYPDDGADAIIRPAPAL